MADQWLCSLSEGQHHPIQELQGPLVGLSQAHATQGIPLVHAVLKPA
jgi:hypothetical protein